MKHTRSAGATLHLLASLSVLVALSSCEQGCAGGPLWVAGLNGSILRHDRR